jgi:crotonobetainyl-CoA:carnitine CoA-transferase CaiB-like acyl-CoA transferase
MVSASNLNQQRKLWQLLGRDDMVKQNNNQRLDGHAAESAALEAAFVARPAAEWEDLLQRAGIPCSRIRGFDEVLADAQIAARPVLHHFDGAPGTVEGMTTTLAGFRMSEGGPSLQQPPQRLGAQSESILVELGYDAEEITALRTKGVIAG